MITPALRQKLSEFFPDTGNDFDEVWQLRAAEAVLRNSIHDCIDGEMLAWARTRYAGALALDDNKTRTNDIIIISAGNSMFDVSRAEQLIDKLVAAGHVRTELRWRMSPMQRRSLRRMLRAFAPLEELHRSTVSGDREESGFFAGLFFVVDPAMRDDAVALEVVRETERVGMITECGMEG